MSHRANATDAVDGTLPFLANAAISHGLSSTVLRNLNQMYTAVRKPHARARSERTRWNPQLPADHAEYKIQFIRPGSKDDLKRQRDLQWRQVDDEAYNPLGEVIKMAEGRDRLTLGRVFQAKFVPQKQRTS